MPNITPFDAGNIAIRPTEVGVESQAAAGRRLGAYGSQIAGAYERAGTELARGLKDAGDAAVNYMDHREINAGADHASALFSNLTDNMNSTLANADVHDPSVAKKWREEQMEPQLQQFLQGFTTEKSQEWANNRVNNLRQHFFVQTEAQMSSRAKAAATASYNNSVTNFSNAVAQNPAGLDDALGQLKDNIHSIIGANPNIKGSDAAVLETELLDKGSRQLVHAGALSTILNSPNPEAAVGALAKKYPDLISGAEELQIAKAAKTQARANLAYDKQIESYNRALQRDDAHASIAKIWSDNVSIDPQTNLPVIKPDFFQEVVKLPARNPQAAELSKTYLDWAEGVQTGKFEKTVPNMTVYGDLNSRLLSADKPLTDIDTLKAESNPDPTKRITHQQGDALRALIKDRDDAPIKDPAFKDTIQAAKDAFTYSSQNTADDPLGSAAFARFVQQFFPEYQKEVRTGTLKQNALNLRDPTSLISQSIAQARGSLQQNVRDTAPPPRDRTIQRITTKAAYDDLEPGSQFYDNAGNLWTKPRANMPAVPESQ